MKILVLCTGNSCRSQIAHAFLSQLSEGKHEVYSAGIETHGVNPKALRVLKEIGIDISHHTSNHVDEYAKIPFDILLTVCDHAAENCPYISGNFKRIHHNFRDPAKAQGTEAEILNEFRRVRDEIKTYSQGLLDGLD